MYSVFSFISPLLNEAILYGLVIKLWHPQSHLIQLSPQLSSLRSVELLRELINHCMTCWWNHIPRASLLIHKGTCFGYSKVFSKRKFPSGYWRFVSFFRSFFFRNLEVPGSNPSSYRYLDLFAVAPSSTPRPRCVNSQLVSLPPVGILNSLCYIWNICLFIYSVPNLHNNANIFDTKVT